ncbi:developmentally-regulated G-protein 2 [Tanacetum coccineum]
MVESVSIMGLHTINQDGHGRVALTGFPRAELKQKMVSSTQFWLWFIAIYSVGKSTLLTMLTGTQPDSAAYEFTTLTCIPGIIHYNGTSGMKKKIGYNYNLAKAHDVSDHFPS